MIDNACLGYSPHVELAKAAIRAYVERGEILEITANGTIACDSADYDFVALLNERAGAFVSIKKLGALRGCIGTIAPACSNLAKEIIANAISACSCDPRFPPVASDELRDLTVSVDVLDKATPVDSISELDVKRYGVIVSKGFRRGLLLPNLEGVDTVAEQLHIALSKAGIHPSEHYDIERFEVVRHELGGYMGVCS